ncbi:MAG: Mbeg1-like protein [Leptolyngbyaceae cyanobacterium]
MMTATITTDQSEFYAFESNAQGYSPNNAWALAKASQLAYKQDKESDEAWIGRVHATTKQWGFSTSYCFDVGGSQAILFFNDETVILAFRGTEELIDWLDDLDFRGDDFYGMTVHQGFNRYFQKLWSPTQEPTPEGSETQGIYAILQQAMQEKPRNLWIAGHSLGAAAATLAAATCCAIESPIPICGVYTYGSPRVGMKKFARWYDKQLKQKTFRFVNNNDIVTRVPTGGILIPYRHVGQYKYFNNSGQLFDGYELSWLTHLLDRMQGRLKDVGKKGLDAIKDHNLGEFYVSLTDNARKGS